MKEEIIRVKNLVKKFGSFTANDNLTFDVYKGEVFGFLGANGAGKTTAIRILSGLSSPTSGELNVAGFDVYTETEKIKKNIGYMSQKFSLYEDLTVAENIRFYAGIYGISPKRRKEKMSELLKKLEMEDAAKEIKVQRAVSAVRVHRRARDPPNGSRHCPLVPDRGRRQALP